MNKEHIVTASFCIDPVFWLLFCIRINPLTSEHVYTGVLNGRAFCTTCGVIDLNVTRYS